jgi:hypothetical protein
MSMTEQELDEMRELLMAYKQQKAATKKRGRKSKKAIAPEPDYDSMSLTEFSGHLNDSMSDCTELTLNSFFEMSRESKKGNKLKAASHAATGVVGTGLLAYGLVEIFSAAFGGRD